MKVHLLIFLWCFHFVVSGLLYLAFMTIVALLIRARIIAVNVGFPPRVLKFRVAETPVAVGLLPSSSSLSFLDKSNRDSHPSVSSDWNDLSDLAAWKRILLILGGPIVFLIVALMTLSFDDFVYYAAVGLPRLFAGALQPFTVGQLCLKSFVNELSASPPRASGILATVFLVWNLIPYFPSPTYRALSVICDQLLGFSLPTNINLSIAIVLMSPFLVPYVGWCIAIGAYFLK